MIPLRTLTNQRGEESRAATKPFSIAKPLVWKAYKHVKANHGVAGVADPASAEVEGNLKENLDTLGTRLSAGRYFPPPVQGGAIAKKDGGQRQLGIPTGAERLAQTGMTRALEPLGERYVQEDS